MSRFGVEQDPQGYYIIVDHYNDNKMCFRTDDKALAEDQAKHLEPNRARDYAPIDPTFADSVRQELLKPNVLTKKTEDTPDIGMIIEW